jgi:hypothetical protein
MMTVVFSGDFGDPELTDDTEQLDPVLAAAELRQAGYEVFLMPDKYIGRLMAHPLDDILEAVVVGCWDDPIIYAIMCEVNAIVGKYGGECYKCRPIGRDYVPFSDLFEGRSRRDLWRPALTERRWRQGLITLAWRSTVLSGRCCGRFWARADIRPIGRNGRKRQKRTLFPN